MPVTPTELLARLDALGIATKTHRHAPVFTVEESQALRGDLPGGHCKSLFLRDKKGNLFLVVAEESRKIELKKLGPLLGARGHLSFASAETLWDVLGVRPGSVTPFGLINDTERRVAVALDRGMLDLSPLNYHPLDNAMTTAIAPADLLRFIEALGYRPVLLDLTTRTNVPE
ncbi:MAG: prolyl-tRNA synthetase associated domain-containing protein [Alphaproteobacteria bacterium]